MDNVETIVIPRTSDLGDDFHVRRALPSAQRRTVGPYVFLDHMGPVRFAPGRGLDVRPHPHIGLATVTYLYDGRITHRDSLGSVMDIRPGELNWMNAGSGIVHSERSPADARDGTQDLVGLQCWVALPKAEEESAPTFQHVDRSELPLIEGDGASACVVAGTFFGRSSPVRVKSPLFQEASA